MYQVKLLKRYLVQQVQLYEDGLIIIPLMLLEILPKENVIMILTPSTGQIIQKLQMLQISIMLMIKKERIVTVESLQEIKEMIYRDKLNLCDKNTQTLLLYKILVLGLIGNVRDLSPLYSPSNQKKWIKLLSHIKTDFVGLLTNYSNKSLTYTKLKSWFSIITKPNQKIQNWQMIFSQLSMFSHVKKWVKEDIKKKITRTKSLKIELKPTKKQIKILNKYIDDSRYTYNKCVEIYNETGMFKKEKLSPLITSKVVRGGFKDIPENDKIIPYWLFITNFQYKEDNYIIPKNFFFIPPKIPKTVYNTPSTIRKLSLKEFEGAVKSAITNKKNKNIKSYYMSFKSKKKLFNQQFGEEKTTSYLTKINDDYKLSICKLKNINVKINNKDKKQKELLQILKTKKVKKEIRYIFQKDIKIQQTKLNKFYLIIPYNEEVKNEYIKNRMCALDPGFRTFMTGVDLKGNMFEIGKNVYDKILKVKYKISHFQGKFKRINSKRGRKSHKEYRAWMISKSMFNFFNLKLKNLIKELHNQTINYLTKFYDIIILPNLRTQNLVDKNKPSWFNKMMLSLNHYTFRMKLNEKCKSLNKTLVVVEEPYTSKTCSNCGSYKPDLGKSKVYNCKHCKNTFDRDLNASCNILKYTLLGKLKHY